MEIADYDGSIQTLNTETPPIRILEVKVLLIGAKLEGLLQLPYLSQSAHVFPWQCVVG